MSAKNSAPKSIGSLVVAVALFALALSGVYSLWPHDVQAQDEYLVYLPVFHIAHSDTESAADSEYAIDTSEWSRYASEAGGYSFLYPAGWTVDETREWPKGVLLLLPPNGEYTDRISFQYLMYEKPESVALIPWLEQYYDVSSLEHMWDFFSMELVSNTVVDESERAFYRYEGGALLKKYYIASGRLVLEMATLSESVGYDDLIVEIAKSVEFNEDGPTSMRQIIEPRFLGSVTIEESLERQRIRYEALAALNKRIRTGKTPDELLQDDAVRARYELLLEQHAREIEESDWLRNKLEELHPGYDHYPQPDAP